MHIVDAYAKPYPVLLADVAEYGTLCHNVQKGEALAPVACVTQELETRIQRYQIKHLSLREQLLQQHAVVKRYHRLRRLACRDWHRDQS